jgi:hypothetical protein
MSDGIWYKDVFKNHEEVSTLEVSQDRSRGA